MFRPQIVEEDNVQIGEELREAREAAGLTIDDVVYQAHLPRSVVEALEAEDFSVFASPTYAKSFLSQYSGFLKVDAEPWLNALAPAPMLSGETFTPLIDSRFTPVEVAPQRESRSRYAGVWLLLLTVGLIYGGIRGYQFLDRKLTEEDPPEETVVQSEDELVDRTASGTPPAIELPPVQLVKEPQRSSTPREDDPEETVQAPPRAIIVRDP